MCPLHVCLCTLHMPKEARRHQWVGSLGLELQTVKSCHVGAADWIRTQNS